MNEEGSQPAALGTWLLRHVYPGQLRNHWVQISFAVSGTLLIRFLGLRIIGQFWPWGIRDGQWLMLTFALNAALCALLVQPILGGLLLLDRAFGWVFVLRTFLISYALLAAPELAVFWWVTHHPGVPLTIRPPISLLMCFFALLMSAFAGCRAAFLSRDERSGVF